MQWSHYSEALFECFRHSDSNIMVQACPGAGKTTNIKHLWSLTDKPTVYLVFNKHNQLEALEKMPQRSGSDVLTLNGLGHRALLNTWGKVTLDNKKTYAIIKNAISYKGLHYREVQARQAMLARAVAIAKCVDTDGSMPRALYTEMLSTYDLDAYSGMYADVLHVLSQSDNMTHVIDFADQLRLPVLYKCNMPAYAVALCDEVQDFNPIQAALLQVLDMQRVVLVGDTHQSIYGFRGAMNDSMAMLSAQFTCTELTLSITYRCAAQIVKEAQKVYPGSIEKWAESPEGIVRHSEALQEDYQSDTIVLCRMNRPLIILAYDLLKRGIACHVRGRDIGQGLVRLIKQQDCTTVRQLITALYTAYSAEHAVADAKDDDVKMQRIEDRYGSALLFCERCSLDDSPQVVIDAIEEMFTDGRGVCLSTVHKAKGLAAEKALVLQPDLIAACRRRAALRWQQEQEDNVRYVAVTRAKRELVYMT